MEYRLVHFVLQKVSLEPASFCTLDGQRFRAPVNIAQAKASDLATAKRVDRANRQDGPSAQRGDWCLGFVPQQLPDFLPRRSFGHAIVFGQSGCSNSCWQPRRAPTAHPGMLKERSERLGIVGKRPETPSLRAFGHEELVDIV
jgi:hypothetical protein